MSYKSFKQETIVYFIDEFVYIFTSKTVKEFVLIKRFIIELCAVLCIVDLVAIYCDNNEVIATHLRSWPSGGRDLFLPPHQGSNLHVHACHPRGALHAHWVCRMFSGS